MSDAEPRIVGRTLQTVVIRTTAKSSPRTVSRNSRGTSRAFGAILLAFALFLAWISNWFHTENDLSKYPQIRLTYETCNFERIVHSRSSTVRQIVFIAKEGRYVMEDGVWGRHFKGPDLANAFSGGGTVRAWVHPGYPHVLRGVRGGPVEIPPEWGLDYDQRNMRAGLCMDLLMVVAGLLFLRPIKHKQPTNSSDQPDA